ncbi:MAG TPA: phosphoribosylaminoimidazolesuccinocarboxamide synthase [Thermoplasmata archaeon]|nr:phosphoribosylaminoimidazolesuccinocarboxamide synthase [Thermoplasmata archaeon]HUJ77542.1 phosphoribosylaminoimidazolesuccinocarboxamide synthase [Thermoplasmata archaeon]
MQRPTSSAAPPRKPQFLRRGKVKEVWEVSPDELEFRFTNDISVFDKHIPNEIPFKGETLAATATFWFELVGRLGIPHHFLGRAGPTAMRVKRVEVVPNPRSLGPKPTNYLVPLELIVRYYVAGSLWDRIKAGSVPSEQLGFRRGKTVAYGEPLPQPLFEATTKLEPVDRLLTDAEAIELAAIDRRQFDALRESCLRIDAAMAKEIEPRGLLHVDGKKEFGIDREGTLMVVDTFGTADEDRFWDREEYGRGRQVDFSKEFVRQHYRSTGYFDQLQAARAAHREEPPIPPLPPLVVDEVSRLYTTVYQRLTGVPFAGAAGPR